ncbi:MAG: hypothetical protein IJT66_03275 [Clostridia bacterium]|nr:hypothetical protein [Clostridia bacterium]
MKPVFEGEVYEILPLNKGILFTYCKEKTEEKITVAYKMISFENGRLTDAPKSIYLLTKFGNHYRSIAPLCGNYVTAKSLLLPNGGVYLLEEGGRARLFDADSSLIWEGEMIYRGQPAADLLLYKNVIWACYPDCNVLLRYSFTTMREEMRIGGNRSPFDRPVSMFGMQDEIMICNEGSKKLIRFHLKNYSIQDEETFPEPVLQYLCVENNRFVRLPSGLYYL